MSPRTTPAVRRISSHAAACRPGALRRALSVRLLQPLGGFTAAAAVMTPAPVNYEQTGLKVCLASGTSKAHINDGLPPHHRSHGETASQRSANVRTARWFSAVERWAGCRARRCYRVLTSDHTSCTLVVPNPWAAAH